MADMIMLRLGEYQFGLATAAYASFKRSTEYRWASLDRHGRRPAQQFLGLGGDEITLDGVIYPHFRGGVGQIAAMREAAAAGEPLDLVSPNGENLGRWCITKIEETVDVFFPGGAPRKQIFSLSLKAYGEDEPR